MKTNAAQLSLFSSVLNAYTQANGAAMTNDDLYRAVAKSQGLSDEEANERVLIGQDQVSRNALAQRVRWYQQTLKNAGVIQRVEGERGVWSLTSPAGKELNKIGEDVSVVGFSTDLGIAILGTCKNTFAGFDAPITLVVTSPPYPLKRARSYGNPDEKAYVDWICEQLEPVVRNLVPGGSICLNISNDVFMESSPARSLYRERLVLALHERLGLYKMDELIWENRSKPPGPVRYASIERTQLNVAWEPIYWFTNDPLKVKSDNRRVLQEHSQAQLDLIRKGGEARSVSNSDGAYIIRPGSYGNQTAGSIPKNVLSFGHRCAAQMAYKRAARALMLPTHGAPMPLKLAMFLIEFLSKPGDLVVDPFGGSFTTADAAERLARQWFSTDCIYEYVLGGSTRFVDRPGYFNQLLAA